MPRVTRTSAPTSAVMSRLVPCMTRQQPHVHRQEDGFLGGDSPVGAAHVVLALQEGLACRHPELGEHRDRGGEHDADVPRAEENPVDERTQRQPADGRGQRPGQREDDDGGR